MKYILAVTFLILSATLSAAQVAQTHQTTELVKSRTQAFFAQLLKSDFDGDRAFMSEQLANITSPAAWRKVRSQQISQTGGPLQYQGHRLTYYQKEKVLAAVDFYGQADDPNIIVCGFLLWEVTGADQIGLVRFELNVVQVDLIRRMPQQEAAQTMVNWRCPTKMVEAILGVSIQN